MVDLQSIQNGSLSSSLQRCSKCGYEEPNNVTMTCMMCDEPFMDPLPPRIDLGVRVDGLEGAAEALPVHRILARYMQINNITFTMAGSALRAEQVFQPEGLLPIVSLEAMRIWQSIEHRPNVAPMDVDSFEIEFKNSDSSFFPMSAHPVAIGSDTTSTLRALVMVLAARRVLGLKENQKIDLVPFIASWDKIDWKGESLPVIPIPEGFDIGYQEHEFASQKVSPLITPAPPLHTVIVPSPFASSAA